ncbi:MAG: Lipopolysaccharide assembly protein A [Chromatiales bacterium USCg_Taylor]|nr:MAG: Lipopolysaccharide assembly protein A [Chromatiales bacterium USCg_Taylor]
MVRVLKVFFLLVVVLVGLELHVKNHQLVVIDYYLGTVQLPVSLLIACMLLLGAVLGVLVNLSVVVRLRRKIGELKRSLKSVDQQLTRGQSITTLKDAS